MEINYKLTISYDGTGYVAGKHNRKPTIQGVIENLLFKVFGKQITLRYPSRTDAGGTCMARWQVLNVNLNTCRKNAKILNTQLPPA